MCMGSMKPIVFLSASLCASVACAVAEGVLPEGAFANRTAAARPEMRTVVVVPSVRLGPIKPVNGVNNAPIAPRAYQSRSNFTAYKAANIPYARNHDAALCSAYGGLRAGDITSMFPDFDKDENDPNSYDFVYTDRMLANMIKAGTEPYFRLGQSIEHGVKKYGIYPPKDFAKWARICEHVIRHYNEGWADGFKWNIRHWEIWNEASNNATNNPTCWGGTEAQFHDFYEVVARHLKARFPDLKIGGPATTGWEEWSERFIVEMARRKVPLDFFSWHCYLTRIEDVVARAEHMRGYLDANGYKATESHLTEWNYVRDWVKGWNYSLSVESGALRMKGAAFIAAFICACQASSVDLATYYDARPMTAMNGLFSSVDHSTLEGYYSIYAWGKLRRLGNWVKTDIQASGDEDDKEDIHAAAAVDGAGNVGLLLARYLDDDNSIHMKRVRVRVEGLSLAGAFAHVVDSHSKFTEVPLEANDDGSADLVLEPYSVVYIAVPKGA